MCLIENYPPKSSLWLTFLPQYIRSKLRKRSSQKFSVAQFVCPNTSGRSSENTPPKSSMWLTSSAPIHQVEAQKILLPKVLCGSACLHQNVLRATFASRDVISLQIALRLKLMSLLADNMRGAQMIDHLACQVQALCSIASHSNCLRWHPGTLAIIFP